MEDNMLNNWISIEELHKFPAGIQEFRVRNNNELQGQMSRPQFRLQIIARIGRLDMLNNSQVRHQERVDAERQYLRSLDPNALRYKELVQIYGQPEDLVQFESQNQNAFKLSYSVVEVQIHSLSKYSIGKSVAKQLPLSMTIFELKSLCHKLFSIPTNEQKLSYRQKNEQPEFLDDNLKDISYYISTSGGEIWVEDK